MSSLIIFTKAQVPPKTNGTISKRKRNRSAYSRKRKALSGRDQKSADPGKAALKNFSVLSAMPEDTGEGAVICMSPMVIPLDEMNKIVPLRAI